ncbi:MAG: thiamine pyrophosphate-requiring protein [Herpetosiphon sp.]
MATMVSDFLVRRLTEWGVSRLFGYSGDGINGLLGALNRAGNKPQFIQVAHEEQGGLMACGHAKWTGEVGVCLSTAGPGAIHLLNGLYDANSDHQPVVAIVGQQATTGLGGRLQQEIDLHSLYKDVAGAYLQSITNPEQVRHVVDRAFRVARAERTVTCIILPQDVQRMDAVEEPPSERSRVHSGIGFAQPRVVPAADDLHRAAAVLNAGKRVAMLVGAGTLQATDEVIAVAERLGAGVAKALLGKAAVPDDLPFVTGSAGWLGTAASNEMLAECDTLFMVGSGFPYSEFLPREGQARGVQIDIDGRMLSLRYPMEVNLIGDSAETLKALLPLLEQRSDSEWSNRIKGKVSRWWQTAEANAMRPANPLNPQRVFWELSPRLPDHCIIAGDCGSSTVWFGRDLKIRRGMQASLSGTLATMGSAVPYALAAKFAFPERVVVATAGDGAMQMSGINALITVAKYWRQWHDPRLVILVLNNRDLNYVTWEQRLMEGEPRFDESQDLLDFPFARYAELLGLRSIRIESPEAVGPAWDEAFAADRPVLIEAITDASVPTVPPQLTEQQESKLRQALAQGDSDAGEALRQVHAEGALPPKA